MKKINVMIVGLAMAFLAVGLAHAQPQGTAKEKFSQKKEQMFKELNLTPEQQKKLDENREVQRLEMEKLHNALKEKQAKLQEELKNSAVSKATLEPLVNEIKSLQAKLIDNRVNGILAVKEILTPEQFAKFQQMHEKNKENRKEHSQKLRDKEKSAAQKPE